MSSGQKKFVLVDINTAEKFILCSSKLVYRCGRGKQNEVVTQSILASRDHCLFIRSKDGFSVCDQDSANGIFINGEQQQKDSMVKLNINDLIGLGCNDMVPNPLREARTRTIYRLLPFEEEEEPPVEPPAQNMADAVPANATINKRKQSNSSLECSVPPKMPKLDVALTPDCIDISDDSDDENFVFQDNNTLNNGGVDVKPKVSPAKDKTAETPSTSGFKDVSRHLETNNEEFSIGAGTSTCFATHGKEKIDANATRLNRAKEKKIETPPKKLQSANIAKNHCPKLSNTTKNADLRPSAAVRETDSIAESVENVPNKRLSEKSSCNNQNSSKESLQFAKPKEKSVVSRCNGEKSSSFSDKTRNARVTETNKNNVKSDDESEDFLVPAFDIDELIADETTAPSKDDRQKSDEPSTSPRNMENQSNNEEFVQATKYEPDLSITDENGPVPNEKWIDFTSFVTPTPIKLKHVKQEPTTRYSSVDESVIELSDDEDGVFVASQLFGDEIDEEIEPKVEVKTEEDDESYREFLEDRRLDRLETIVVSDSEDEENPWYDRLLRSQLQNDSRRSLNEIERKVPVENGSDFDIDEPVEEPERATIEEETIEEPRIEEEFELPEDEDLFDDDDHECCTQDIEKEIFEICHTNEIEKTTKDVPKEKKKQSKNDRSHNENKCVEENELSAGKETLEANKSPVEKEPTEKLPAAIESRETEKLDVDKNLPEERRSTAKKSTNEKKLSADEKLLKNKKLHTDEKAIKKTTSSTDEKSVKERLSSVRKSIEQKRSSIDVKSTEQKRSSIDGKSIEQKRSSIDGKSIEQKRSSIEEKSTEQKRSSIEVKSIEHKRTSTDTKSIEQKRSSIDGKSTEQKRSSIAVTSIEQIRPSIEVKSIEQKRSSIDGKSIQKKRSSIDGKSIEQKRPSIDGKSIEQKRTSIDVESTEQKRSSIDAKSAKVRLSTDRKSVDQRQTSVDDKSLEERMSITKKSGKSKKSSEKKSSSTDDRSLENKRVSTDERLPEKKSLPVEERLPEERRSSDDKRLPEKRKLSADKRLPNTITEKKTLSLEKELPGAKSVSVDKQSSHRKSSVPKEKSVEKYAEDGEVGSHRAEGETKISENARKRRRSDETKASVATDSTNDFVQRNLKDSAVLFDSDFNLRKKALVLLEKVDSGRKCVQIVEPPFLGKGEHRGVSLNIKTANKSIDKGFVASTSTNDPEKVSTRKLTTKEKKEEALKARIAKRMQQKEQRLRRMKNKWAADSLPEKKTPSSNSPFNSDERKDFREERSKRLKQITEDEKMAKDGDKQSPAKRIVKPRAKITTLSRNDFLVMELEEQMKQKEKSKTIEQRTEVAAHSEQVVPEKKDKSTEATKHRETRSNSLPDASTSSEPMVFEDVVQHSEAPKEVPNKHKRKSSELRPEPNVVPRSVHAQKLSSDKDKSVKLTNGVAVNGEINRKIEKNSVKSIPKKTKSATILLERSELPKMLPEKTSIRGSNNTKEIVPPIEPAASSWAHGFGKHSERIGSNLTNTNVEVPSKLRQDPRVKIGMSEKLLKENREPSRQFGEPRTKKRVSFDDLKTRVNLFEIDPGNTLNKCISKDAPLLVKRPPKCSIVDPKLCCPKLEQFLLHIFKWNPAWLWEQKKLSTPAPVVDDKNLVPLLSKYATYEDYYNVTEPLLVLELWYEISREFEACISSEKGCFNYSIVHDSATLTTVPSTKFRVTTLILEIVVSRRDANSRSYPGWGDLISFEYISKKKGRSCSTQVFAYITDVRSSIITPIKFFNRDLLHFVKDAHTLVTYTVMTKPLDGTDLVFNKVNRLRKISYLRSNIRMIQALQNLPVSPLKDTILRPTIEDYQLPPVGRADELPLVTKDKLNPKQLEAVIKITNAAVQRLPKVCLIHGPPGTGKSRVIVNIVTHILHVNAECYKNKKIKILVCAPSNAAIDEIVLRLLEIRQSLDKKNRFNMVRIGRTEKMNPQVKPVSLTELGVQDVKKTMNTYTSPNYDIDSVEEEKRFLQARINSLELEKSNTTTRGNPMYQKQIVRKLQDIEAKYNLLKHRQSADQMDATELAKLQKAAENGLLKGADVIACTLTSCYTNNMETIFGGKDSLSVCIVDEATQSAEAETLIPLMLGVKTLVLVGDTNQLPATILSQKAKQFGLDQSLFARVENAFDGEKSNPIIKLDTQYRMASPVSYWPNLYFYGGAVKNGLDNYRFPLHGYKVLNLDSKQDDEDKLSNTEEAAFIANVVLTLMTASRLDCLKNPVKIGVITPYNNQKQLVTQKIRERIKQVPVRIKDKISHEVNTVDSFQGQERDIILMSCVRSSGIGFLSDPQRLCVALTRAKHSLILCGNFQTFEKDPMWRALLSDARDRNVYVNIRADANSQEIKKHIVR